MIDQRHDQPLAHLTIGGRHHEADERPFGGGQSEQAGSGAGTEATAYYFWLPAIQLRTQSYVHR